VKTPRKQAPRATLTVNLPLTVIRQLQEIANVAGLTVDQVVAVVIATKLVQMKLEEGAR